MNNDVAASVSDLGAIEIKIEILLTVESVLKELQAGRPDITLDEVITEIHAGISVWRVRLTEAEATSASHPSPLR